MIAPGPPHTSSLFTRLSRFDQLNPCSTLELDLRLRKEASHSVTMLPAARPCAAWISPLGQQL
jgi:hypothetical protein